MKHIIFLTQTLTKDDVVKLEDALNQTRAIVQISMATSTVTIEGSNDVLHHAKQVILSLGYTIQ